MANPDRPRGFTPVRHLNGGSWNNALAFRARVDDEAFDEGGATGWTIGVGTPVRFNAFEDLADNLQGLPSVIPMEDETANQLVYGVVVGIGNTTAGDTLQGGETGPWDASLLEGPNEVTVAEIEADVDKYVLYVAPALDWVYEVQSTETAEAIGVGSTCAIMNTASTVENVTSTTGRSLETIGLNSEGGADEVQLRVIGFKTVDNDIELADANYEVLFVDAWPGSENQ